MRSLVLFFAAVLLLLPPAKAQSLAYNLQPATPPLKIYSPASFSQYDVTPGKYSNLTKTGTIMSGAGIVLGAAGILLIIKAENDNSLNSLAGDIIGGATLFVVGGGLGITGAVLSMVGLHKDHRRRSYGFHIVAPKSNQVGIAYNF